MPYAQIEFIAACLNTYPGLAWTDHVAKPTALAVPRYDGSDDDAADCSARLILMGQAVEKAVAASRCKGQRSVLKVFMAPEFSWRGAKGAYPVDTIDDLHQQLHAIASAPAYEDWLFVWGTAIGATYGQFAPNEPAAEITNAVLVSEGGTNGAMLRLAKDAMSSIDFLAVTVDNAGKPRPRASAIRGGLAWLADKPQRVFHAAQAPQQGVEGGVFFEAKGIRFGVEICLDHYCKRIKKALAGHPKPRAPQVILVPSCGMTLLPDSIPALPDVLAFNVDGGCYFKDGVGATYRTLADEVRRLRVESADPYDSSEVARIRKEMPAKVFRYAATAPDPMTETFVAPSQVKLIDAPGFAAAKAVLAEVFADATALSAALKAMPGGYYKEDLSVRADKKQVAFTVLTKGLAHATSRLALKRALALIGITCLLNRRAVFTNDLPTSFNRLLTALNGSLGTATGGLAELFGKYGYRNVAKSRAEQRALDAASLRDDIVRLAARYYAWEVPRTGAFSGGPAWNRMIEQLGGATRTGGTRARIAATERAYLLAREREFEAAHLGMATSMTSFQGYGAVIAFERVGVPAR